MIYGDKITTRFSRGGGGGGIWFVVTKYKLEPKMFNAFVIFRLNCLTVAEPHRQSKYKQIWNHKCWCCRITVI